MAEFYAKPERLSAGMCDPVGDVQVDVQVGGQARLESRLLADEPASGAPAPLPASRDVAGNSPARVPALPGPRQPFRKQDANPVDSLSCASANATAFFIAKDGGATRVPFRVKEPPALASRPRLLNHSMHEQNDSDRRGRYCCVPGGRDRGWIFLRQEAVREDNERGSRTRG